LANVPSAHVEYAPRLIHQIEMWKAINQNRGTTSAIYKIFIGAMTAKNISSNAIG